MGAIGSPRAPLPDPSLKKGTFSTGAPAEWFKGGHQFWAKNAILGDAPRASGLGAIGSPRAPLPDPSLKKGTFSTGAPAEWFKGGHQFWAKNAILGANFQFFSI